MSSSNQPNHPYALQSVQELEEWKKADDAVTLKLAKISAVGILLIVALLVGMMWILSSHGASAGALTLIG